MKNEIGITIIFFFMFLTNTIGSREVNKTFFTEIGIQGGGGYYVGDATKHIFRNIKETYGAHFRYKFDMRWAIQAKGLYQHISGTYTEDIQTFEETLSVSHPWKNDMVNADLCVEFNFFRLGLSEYDKRVKKYSPYIFLGFGVSLYNDKFSSVGCYLPIGIGFKYNFARRWGINIAWQHNIFLRDNIEGVAILNNTHKLNGSNIMNNDITSQFTFALILELIPRNKICRICDP